MAVAVAVMALVNILFLQIDLSCYFRRKGIIYLTIPSLETSKYCHLGGLPI